jgi:ABC-type glutathione transport system ATPase component
MTAQGAQPLVEVRNLVKRYTRRRWLGTHEEIAAVNDVSFAIARGETLGLVGESGSGKTTTGRCLLRLVEPTSGEVMIRGENLLTFSRRGLRRARRDMQMVFQDPYSSLNPRMRAGAIVEEPLAIHREGTRSERRARVEDLFRLVGLDPALESRLPRDLSTGQRQRVGLARALALRPSFLVCDEPLSALDGSVQAQVINLLQDLREQLALTCLFITHDLRVARHLCHRIAVMHRGQVVEIAPTEQLFESPDHPHSRRLVRSVRL